MLPSDFLALLMQAGLRPLLVALIAVVGLCTVVLGFLAITFRWIAVRMWREAQAARQREQVAVSAELEAPDAEEQPDKGEEAVLPVLGRRTFLKAMSLGLGGIGAAIVGIPFIGVLISPVRREDPEVWRPVGTVDDFPLGSTVQVNFRDAEELQWAGFAARTAAWLRRDGEQDFLAFSAYCSHVGCPVRWEEGAGLFMCPCHGGAFYPDGTVAAGPPPAPLELYNVRVRDGQVEIQTRPVPLSG